MNDTRYIIVLFYQSIGHTLQTDDKPHILFSKQAKLYKNLTCAVKKAKRLFNQYETDKACVFKIILGEHLSYDQYRGWVKDKERLMFSITRNN